MVEADPKSITPARLTRRAALTQAAGAMAVAAGLGPDPAHVTTPLPHRDAALMMLGAELRAADAAWQRTLDALAHAEQRLFALHPTPPADILVPDPHGGALANVAPAFVSHSRRRPPCRVPQTERPRLTSRGRFTRTRRPDARTCPRAPSCACANRSRPGTATGCRPDRHAGHREIA